MIEAHSDHGTVVQPNESALVVDEDGGLRLLLADYEDVPEMVLLLGAVLVKSRDPEWVADMIADMTDG